jgi:hypothetical protein
MRFTFNHLVYDVPSDVDILVEVDDEHADFNFLRDGEIIAMLGGIDEKGEVALTWEDIGVKQIVPQEKETA